MVSVSAKVLSIARQIDPNVNVNQDTHLDYEFDVKSRASQLLRSEQRPQFFDYQRELVFAGLKVLRDGDRGLISLPTGGGKTRTAVGSVLELFSANSASSVIWIAPTIELLDQAHDTFEAMWQMHGSVGDIELTRRSQKPTPGLVWLTTPQGLSAVDSTDNLIGWSGVIFDEAHQIAAPTFSAATKSVLSRNGPCGLLGLSATPGRTSSGEIEVLAEMFNRNLLVSELLGSNPVRFLQRRGVLSRLQFKSMDSNGMWLSPGIPRSIAAVKEISKIAKEGRQVLVFAQSVAESEAIAIVLNGSGISASHVDGQLSEQVRRSRIARFASGKTTVLVNQRLLSTGYDCPAVSDIAVIPRVSSSILFEQMVGRAARGPRTGGSGLSTIWQFDDHLAIHGLPQSYYRYLDYEWN